MAYLVSLFSYITLRKGKCNCVHLIFFFVSYDHLSSSTRSFIASLGSISIPKIVHETLSHPSWCATMVEVITVLDNCTLGLSFSPCRKEAYRLQMVVFS